METWEKYKVDVPEGQAGDYTIARFTVSKEEEEYGKLRAVISFRGRYVSAGTYTKLVRGDTILMSDTRDEIRDAYSIILHARGNVLINGLGLGMVARGCLINPDVHSVKVRTGAASRKVNSKS